MGPSYIFKFLAEKIFVYNVIKPWAKIRNLFNSLYLFLVCSPPEDIKKGILTLKCKC